jgi:DNA polymerase type B, organellar and viral
MQKRKAHYMRSAGPGSWPIDVLVFHVDYSVGVGPDGTKERMAFLSQWQVVHLTRVGKEWFFAKSYFGDNVDDFHQLLRCNGPSKHVQWIFSLGTCFQLSLLQFWQQVDAGAYRLEDTTDAGEAADDSEVVKAPCGPIALSDPPTIICCRESMNRGMLKFVDFRNYGVDVIPEIDKTATPCENLAGWLSGWLNSLMELDCGGLQATAASQAMTLFKRKYLRSAVYVHNDNAALWLEREALAGGRCECFEIGHVNGPVHQLDFASYYPRIATWLRVPTTLTGRPAPMSIECLHDQVGSHFCVADVVVSTDRPYFPLKSGCRVIFPVGQFRTVLCGLELTLALKCDKVKRVNSVAIYNAERLLMPFCVDMISWREDCVNKKDRAGADCAKRLANSCFGKFAQRQWDWCDVQSEEPEQRYSLWWQRDPEDGQLHQWRSVAGRVQKQQHHHESRESMPGITAAIYATGRTTLCCAMEDAGWNNLYYCDTDSIWTNHTGYCKLCATGWLDPEHPAKLRQIAVHDWVIFRGLKHYELPGKRKEAGIPSHATRVGDRTFQWETGERLSGSLARNAQPTGLVLRRTVSYTGPYKHGVVGVNGRIAPFFIQDER